MKKILGVFVSLVMVMALAMPVYGADNETVNVDVDVTYGQTEARSMLQMINDWRNAGTWYYDSNNNKVDTGSLSSLQYDYDLEAIAMKRAAQIAAVFAHQQPDGTSIYDMTSNGVRSYGENIAAGQTSAAAAFKSWQEEDCDYSGQGHRRNMLSTVNISCTGLPKTFTSIGIGHAVVGGVHYWVQEFNIDDPISSATAANDGVTPVNVSITKNLIKGLKIDVSEDVNSTISYGDSITLPKCIAYFDIDSTVSSIPVTNATFSWGETTQGTISGDTLTLNSDILNTNVSLIVNASYNEWTGSENFNYYVECTHKQKKYESLGGEGHKLVCAVCGEWFMQSSHDFSESQIIKQPTCTQEGTRQYTCTDCGFTETEKIAKIAHNWVTVKGTPATKSSTGLSDGMKCSVCGTWKTRQSVIPKLTSAASSKKTTPTKVTINVTKANTKQSVYTFQKVTLKAKGAKNFKSSNKKIVTVSKKGVLKIRKAGTLKITFVKDGKKYTVTLKIRKPSLKLSASKVNIKVKKTYTLKVKKVTPVNPVTFTTKNKKIATVSAKGVITGRKKGTTYVTAQANGIKKTVKVTVK